MIGAGLTLVGMPGAFPYLGAIDQILREDPGPTQAVFALLFYNIVFLLPLLSLLVVRILLPTQSEKVFRRVSEIAEVWGGRIIAFIVVFIGVLFVVDGIGWFMGHPLFPVG